MKAITRVTKRSIRTIVPSLFIIFALSGLALCPIAQAVVPPPDGGYPNFNTAEGQRALFSLTTGQWNTALGAFTLWKDTDGSYNTAVGTAALLFNVGDQSTARGIENTAVGAAALLLNANGSFNTAVGTTALLNNTADGNTAVGVNALKSNTAGFGNTATGLRALELNDGGIRNTAVGVYTLNHNVSGGGNTAVGYQALANNTADGNTALGNDTLVNNTTGGQNTAVGAGALASNDSGHENTAVGFNALESTTVGGDNTATDFGALSVNNGTSNTANGAYALTNNTGSANTAVGAGALLNNTSGVANIALGFDAGINVNTANNVICIGADGQNVSNSCYIGQIFGVTSSSGTAVYINSDGQLGTATSSARFKENIQPMENTSEAILSLKPMTFRYKSDKKSTPQFGLIAEEVAEVYPDLVVRDKEGKPYSVRYEQVNAMLLNEFLKEHKRVEEQQTKIGKQEATIAELKLTVAQQQRKFDSKIALQQAQIEALTSGLQKVSAQMEQTKPARRVVASSPGDNSQLRAVRNSYDPN